jgi:cell division protein FtsI (penicillin-binding protein 3)
MAGKTGTAAVNYSKDGGSGKYYALLLLVISSWYSQVLCIVVVHKPVQLTITIMELMWDPFLKELLKIFRYSTTNEIKNLNRKFKTGGAITIITILKCK